MYKVTFHTQLHLWKRPRCRVPNQAGWLAQQVWHSLSDTGTYLGKGEGRGREGRGGEGRGGDGRGTARRSSERESGRQHNRQRNRVAMAGGSMPKLLLLLLCVAVVTVIVVAVAVVIVVVAELNARYWRSR